MAELFDTAQVPDDPEHWHALAARVAAHAVRTSPAGFDRFSRSRSGWIAAGVLLAAALVLLMLPAGNSSAGPSRILWAQALAPADEVGRAIALPDTPPPVGALLFGSENGEAR